MAFLLDFYLGLSTSWISRLMTNDFLSWILKLHPNPKSIYWVNWDIRFHLLCNPQPTSVPSRWTHLPLNGSSITTHTMTRTNESNTVFTRDSWRSSKENHLAASAVCAPQSRRYTESERKSLAASWRLSYSQIGLQSCSDEVVVTLAAVVHTLLCFYLKQVNFKMNSLPVWTHLLIHELSLYKADRYWRLQTYEHHMCNYTAKTNMFQN